MFEIGTSTHAIAGFGPPSKPFEEALWEVHECGFTHVLLLTQEDGPGFARYGGDPPSALISLERSDLSQILWATALNGLRVSSVYPGFPLDFSLQGMDKTVDRLRLYTGHCYSMGCHKMLHSAGSAGGARKPFAEKADAIRRLAEMMDAVASDEPGAIFKMAVDVHYGGVVETVADCRYLLEQARKTNAGLCLNIGHMTTLGEPGWELIREAPERIHVIAWKDHLVGPDLPQPVTSCELGKGASPFERYVEVLRTVPVQADHLITFEHVPFEEKKDALCRSRQYLDRLLRG